MTESELRMAWLSHPVLRLGLIAGLGFFLAFVDWGTELAVVMLDDEPRHLFGFVHDVRTLLLAASLMAGWFLCVSLAGRWISAAILRVRNAGSREIAPSRTSLIDKLSNCELYGNATGLALLMVFDHWLEHFLGERAVTVLCLPLPAYLGALVRCVSSLRITIPLRGSGPVAAPISLDRQ